MTSPLFLALSSPLNDWSDWQTTPNTPLTTTPPTPLDSVPFPLDLDSLLPSFFSLDPDGLDVDTSFLPIDSHKMYNQTSYAHYQPPPAPLHPLPPVGQQPPPPAMQTGGQAGYPFAPFSQAAQPTGLYYGGGGGGQQKPATMGVGFPGGMNGGFVGTQAGDFELFGGVGRGSSASAYAVPPAQQQPLPQQQGYNPYIQPAQQRQYPIPIPPSPASTSSSHANSLSADYPPLPDLIPDAGSPASGASQNSPPSPRRFSISSQSSNGGGGSGAFSFARPPFLSAAAAGAIGKSSGRSFRPAMGLSPSSSASSFGSFGAGIERPASVPIPDPPRPVRRKTQERRDWPSFYSSGSTSSASSSSSGAQYMPFAPPAQVTDEPASYATPTLPSHQQQQQQTFDLNFSLSPSPAYPYYPASSTAHLPHTDHPLLPSEQTDLLERVRRDLLELSDVDLSSIKGPLRALALSGTGADRDTTPTPSSIAGTGTAQLTPKNIALRSPAAALRSEEETLPAGTVSPQEAFLDYPSVDSRLHDPRDPLYVGTHGEFGVGASNLFAPLPGQQVAPSHSPSPAYAAPSPAPASPRTSSATATATATASPHPAHRRGPHPFSVPQNAVTWAQRRSQSGQHWLGGVVDGDADDDDGDFSASVKGEESEGPAEKEKEREREMEGVRERARLGEGFGRFRKEEVDLRKRRREGTVKTEEEEAYGVTKAEVDGDEGPPFAAAVVGQVGGKAPVHAARPPQPQQLQQQSQQPFAFAPPPLSLSQHQPHPPHLPQNLTPQQHSLLAAAFSAHQNASNASHIPSSSASAVPSSLLPALPAGEDSGTNTPQRSAAASALAGLHGGSANGNGNAFTPPTPAFAAPPPPPAPQQQQHQETISARPQRQRKRSRIARAAYGEDSDEAAAGGAEEDGDYVAAPPSTASSTAHDQDGGHESDGSYHSSASSFAAAAPTHRRTASASSSSAAPPPKRRRRAPVTSAGSLGPNAIRCDHSNADGTVCGVAFRRPYDLARHKETIHGEGLGGEKLARSKEWRCESCGGTFSRKDALLRHFRIKGHSGILVA